MSCLSLIPASKYLAFPLETASNAYSPRNANCFLTYFKFYSLENKSQSMANSVFETRSSVFVLEVAKQMFVSTIMKWQAMEHSQVSARAFVWWDDKTQYLYKRLNKCVLQLRCKWAISLESITEMAYYHHFPSGWRGLPDIPSLVSRLSSVAHHSSSSNFTKALLLPVRISLTLWHWWLYFSFCRCQS